MLRSAIERLKRYLAEGIWRHDLRQLPLPRALAYRTVRILYLAAHGTARDKAFLRASALTFVTLLSLPPVLALAFGIGRTLGATNLLRDVIFQKLGGEDEKIREVLDQIFVYVDQTPLSVLSGIGVGILFFAVIKLLGTIEGAFNEIFGAPRARPFLRKVADYLSVIVVAPIVLTLAAGGVTSLRNQAMVKWVSEIPVLGSLVKAPVLASLVMLWLGFTFVYIFLPNVRVRFRAAALGAFLAACGWLLAYQVFLGFQIGLSRANIIYGSFAGIPLLLLWLQVSWGIVLLGAEIVAALHRETSFRHAVLAGDPSPAERERLAVRILLRLAEEFLEDRGGMSTTRLVEVLDLPMLLLQSILSDLERKGIVARAAGDEEAWLLARDPRHVRLLDLLVALRETGEDEASLSLTDRLSPTEKRGLETLRALEGSLSESPRNASLYEMLDGSPPVARGPDPTA